MVYFFETAVKFEEAKKKNSTHLAIVNGGKMRYLISNDGTLRNQAREAPKLIICGTGPMEEWCRRFLEDNPKCNIELRGFVPNKEAKKLIANSKALILPTQWYEGFPMTIVEAYSVGTPVIGSDIGNVGDLIEEGTGGLKFNCRDSKSLINAVNLLSQNLLDSHEISDFYSKHYSSEANYNMIIKIYQTKRGSV